MAKSVFRVGLICATGGDERSYGLPLGVGYLANYLRRAAEETSSLEVLATESVAELLDFKPQLVGISSVTSCFNQAMAIASQVKEACGAWVVGGGYHVSALPHKLPDCFDAAVIGEGEETLEELVTAASQGTLIPESLSRMAGLAYREADQIIINERRPLISSLDSLPHPQRTLNPCRPEEATIFTSRGCPYQCIFCSSCRHWRRIRSFSAPYVVEEIEAVLAAFPEVNSFYILDDLFIANRRRLREIVKLLETKGLTSRIIFRGFVRSNLVDEECCELLARMNCREVRFGAETASPRILERLKVGTTLVADHQRCIDLCNQYGLEVGASWMVGNPGETRDDLQCTYDFIVRNKNKAKVEGFYLLTPLPGTPIWDDCLAKDLVSEEMDWSRLNLSFDNPDFCWEDFIYINDSMSRQEFVESVRNQGLLLRHEIKLELGAGAAPTPGFLHLDIQPGFHIEYVADAKSLPFLDDTIAQIYSRHNLEHFTEAEAETVVKECLRVLKPGGEIYLIVPNMDFHIEQYYTGDQAHARAGFWGWQRNAFDIHKWGYWWGSLHNLLANAGFAHIEDFTGKPDSRHRHPLHLEVRAFKPRPGESPSRAIDFSRVMPLIKRSEQEALLKQLNELRQETAEKERFIQRVTSSFPYRCYRLLKRLFHTT